MLSGYVVNRDIGKLIDLGFVAFWFLLIWFLRSRSPWLKLQKVYRVPRAAVDLEGGFFRSVHWMRVENNTYRNSVSVALTRDFLYLKPTFWMFVIMGFRVLAVPIKKIKVLSKNVYRVEVEGLFFKFESSSPLIQ